MAVLKLCGLFRPEDITWANEAESAYVGFVFAKSPRQVTAAQAAKLREGLRDSITPVGVFVNAAPTEIAALHRSGIIDAAQLHGSEDGAYIAALKAACPGLKVIKALRVESRRDIAASETGPADFLLLDNGTGGTGRPFDWSLLRGAPLSACFIAGGITVATVDAALRFHPYGIDVSTGAETNGVKDRDKMLALAEKVRNFARNGSNDLSNRG
jgi:phosphoribosylanthranilate isomerase